MLPKSGTIGPCETILNSLNSQPHNIYSNLNKTVFLGFHALSAEQKKQLFGKKGNRASSLQELQQRYMDKMADLKGNRPDGRKNKKGKLSKVEKKKMTREAKKKLAKVKNLKCIVDWLKKRNSNPNSMMNRYVRRSVFRTENEERLIFSLMRALCF